MGAFVPGEKIDMNRFGALGVVEQISRHSFDEESAFFGKLEGIFAREDFTKAPASPRLRMNLDLRNSPADSSQRMLNALEPGTVMPVHRHRGSSETVVILRGKIQWVFYDDSGCETERVTLDANGPLRMLNVERNRWHSLMCLESCSVLFECKDGGYHPLEDDEIMEVLAK